MFTGCGALVALGIFLPLPARFQKAGKTPAEAVADSYYVVGSIALVVSILCLIGLRNLRGESGKGVIPMVHSIKSLHTAAPSISTTESFLRQPGRAILLGFRNPQIGLGYLGGFVARASSVGISLFIPLFVNAYFIRSGLCSGSPDGSTEEIKRQCRRAYILSAELSGVSQLVALLCAPVFGYLADRYRKGNIPLLVAALAGVAGYVLFAALESPEPSGENGSPAVFLAVVLLGISQIGAIVCSLGLLGEGVLSREEGAQQEDDSSTQDYNNNDIESQATDTPPTNDTPSPDPTSNESSPLLSTSASTSPQPPPYQAHQITSSSDPSTTPLYAIKGSIAGIYSLAGGAGILLLTKLGGVLFDKLSPGAPFYMLAIFNGVLLLVGLWRAGVEWRSGEAIR